MNNIRKNSLIFIIGGVGYAVIELLWRQRTHWTMAVTGGTCFSILFRFYNKFSRMSLALRCVCGGAIITTAEFICGCIVNLKFKMDVWDYSHNKLNFKGQICPLYSFLWTLLCLPINGICKKLQNVKALRIEK